MFFHVDESGNTGNNLFDKNQPVLSYGVLSSCRNVDLLGNHIHASMCKKIGVDTLHASELGVARLTEIAPNLMDLQRKMGFRFDYYFIYKPAYALVMFFEAVFDAGLNKAVPWMSYWTPMRYILINNLSVLLSEEDLKESWRLCLHPSINEEAGSVVSLLERVLNKVDTSSLDIRSKEIFSDSFRYGIAHPLDLDFGVPDPKIISPNAVCFQFVVAAMARRLRKKKRKDALGIVVDRQVQFNPAQIDMHRMARRIEGGLKEAPDMQRGWYLGHPLHHGLDDADLLRRNTPNKEIDICISSERIGLQIVDIYLWILNRKFSGKELSDELLLLAEGFFSKSFFDGISLELMQKRWQEFERKLPKFDAMTIEQAASAQKVVSEHRKTVQGLI